MNIGIIGTGHIGGILAELWSHSGHQVMVSSRHPQRLESVVKRAGSTCRKGSIEEAAQFGEIVVISVPLGQIGSVVQKTGNYLNGKVIIDTMNPCIERDGPSACDIVQRNIPSGVATQEKLPKARVVRAFCSISFIDLKPMSHREPDFISVPFSSDDETAKSLVMQLIYDAGFEPYYLGSLNKSKSMDPGGIIFGKALTEMQIKDLLFYERTHTINIR